MYHGKICSYIRTKAQKLKNSIIEISILWANICWLASNKQLFWINNTQACRLKSMRPRSLWSYKAIVLVSDRSLVVPTLLSTLINMVCTQCKILSKVTCWRRCSPLMVQQHTAHIIFNNNQSTNVLSVRCARSKCNTLEWQICPSCACSWAFLDDLSTAVGGAGALASEMWTQRSCTAATNSGSTSKQICVKSSRRRCFILHTSNLNHDLVRSQMWSLQQMSSLQRLMLYSSFVLFDSDCEHVGTFALT